MTIKHLPGQHDQQKHGHSQSFFGSDRADKLMIGLNIAGLYPSVDSKNSQIILGKGTTSAVLLIEDTYNIGAVRLRTLVTNRGNRRQITDYTKMTDENVADFTYVMNSIEKAVKNSGFKEIHVEPDRMPVTYAAKSGYVLYGLSAMGEYRLAEEAAEYLNDVYGFEVPESPDTELSAVNQSDLTGGWSVPAKTLISLKHPTAGIPMYLEYLMRNRWDHGNKFVYYRKTL